MFCLWSHHNGNWLHCWVIPSNTTHTIKIKSEHKIPCRMRIIAEIAILLSKCLWVFSNGIKFKFFKCWWLIAADCIRNDNSLRFNIFFYFWYRLKHFIGDLVAGLTVGLTVIPQGLAYAKVAELPPQVSDVACHHRNYCFYYYYCYNICLFKLIWNLD